MRSRMRYRSPSTAPSNGSARSPRVVTPSRGHVRIHWNADPHRSQYRTARRYRRYTNGWGSAHAGTKYRLGIRVFARRDECYARRMPLRPSIATALGAFALGFLSACTPPVVTSDVVDVPTAETGDLLDATSDAVR